MFGITASFSAGQAAALMRTQINGITTTNFAALSATTGILASSFEAIPAVTASEMDPLTITQCEAFTSTQINAMGIDSAWDELMERLV